MAVAITVVIAAIMVSVTVTTLSVWRKAQDSFTTDATAQLIFDFLERDLQGAIVRRDNNIWLTCETFDDDLVNHDWLVATTMKPAGGTYVPADSVIGEARFSRSGHWFRFFTTSGVGPISVSYQIVRSSTSSATSPDPESIRYSLFRETSTASTTFATGYDVTQFDALIKPSSSHNAGTNVIDFGVWFYRTEPDGELRRIFPQTNGEAFILTQSDVIDAVDAMVRVLTDEGAAKISAIERGLVSIPSEFEGDADAWWWSVADAHSKVYVRRMRLKTKAW